MRDLSVPVFQAGEYLATNDGTNLTFFRVGLDGALTPSSDPFPLPEGQISDVLAPQVRGSEPPQDKDGNPVTRETVLEDLVPQLTVRTYNVLKREGIHTVGDALDRDPRELSEVRNFGSKSADELAAHRYEWRRAGLGL